jgi:hypothetical protein
MTLLINKFQMHFGFQGDLEMNHYELKDSIEINIIEA